MYNENITIVKMMRGKKAENEKKNEPRYFTKSVANPTRTNLSIFGKFSVRVNNIAVSYTHLTLPTIYSV